MIEEFLDLVDGRLLERSGAVFYSGRAAFAGLADLYILGLNPGGSPERQATETVGRHMTKVLHQVPDRWSEYADERWQGKPPGTHGMQPRLRHMLSRLGRDPHLVPASNVAFVRSAGEAGLKAEKAELLRRCWPVHDAVIRRLGVCVVLCLGGTAGSWVREMLGADRPVQSFVERNDRGWRSEAHSGADGRYVVTVTHPGRADWRNPAADPSPLVAEILHQAGASAR